MSIPPTVWRGEERKILYRLRGLLGACPLIVRLFHEKVKRLLDEAILEDFKGLRHDRIQTVDADHGRIETRQVWMTDAIESLPSSLLDAWAGLASLAVVESKREVNGQASSERRYFISSLSDVDAGAMAKYIRGHWSVRTACTGNWT